MIPGLLKTFALLLIVFGMVMAAIAHGFADQLSPRAAGLIHDIYMWYEHYFRDLTVLLGAFLTYVLVFGGTYVLGGRWQCSRLCFMNDVHAETLGEAAYNSF